MSSNGRRPELLRLSEQEIARRHLEVIEMACRAADRADVGDGPAVEQTAADGLGPTKQEGNQ